jgi:hypothetical protein
MAFVVANSTDSHGNTVLINAIRRIWIAWMLIEMARPQCPEPQWPDSVNMLHVSDQELVRLAHIGR